MGFRGLLTTEDKTESGGGGETVRYEDTFKAALSRIDCSC